MCLYLMEKKNIGTFRPTQYKWLTVIPTDIATATVINGAYHVVCGTDVLTGEFSRVW